MTGIFASVKCVFFCTLDWSFSFVLRCVFSVLYIRLELMGAWWKLE
jgi:hypothetical protein